MKEQVYAPDPLNEQASVLVDAQTDIKTAIKQSVLSGETAAATKVRVNKIIERAVARIRSPTLRKDGKISLMRFADVTYAKFIDDLKGISPIKLAAVIVLMRAITDKQPQGEIYRPNTVSERRAAITLSYTAYNKGIPLQEFHKTYMQRVDKALENLAQSYALDPNDFNGRNSLRNLAEMQVRYERHQDEIAGFKERGTKLVVCSVHADCSDRCKDWQGLVYSMDGSSGYTEDGKYYQPLENATDIFYTTKAGKVYKNGLLGFNCRHKLFEYKPKMIIPTVNEEEQKREYAITQKQRAMEREVISAREMALCFKDADSGFYRKWKNIAAERYEAYKRFSKDNGRAYYPDRVKIL